MEPGKVCQFSTATNGHIITNTVTVANVQVDYSMRTALTVAALKGHVEVVQMLLQSGKVHVDRQDLRVSMLFINHLPILFMYIMLYILYIYIYFAAFFAALFSARRFLLSSRASFVSAFAPPAEGNLTSCIISCVMN